MNLFKRQFVSTPTLMAILAALALGTSQFFFGGQNGTGRFILFGCGGILLLFTAVNDFRFMRLTWWRNPDVWFFAFLLLGLCSFAITKSRLVTFDAFADVLLWWSFFLAGRTIRDARQQRIFFGLLVIGAISMTFWSLWLVLQLDTPTSRLYGSFKNPGGLGPALLPAFVIAWTWTVSTVRRSLRFLAGSAALILSFALFLTSSIASGLGLLLAFVATLFFFQKRISRKIAILSVLVLILLLFGAYFFRNGQKPDTSLEAFTGVDASGSFQQRWSFVRSSLAMAADAPLTGQGLGMWPASFPHYQRSVQSRTTLAHGLVPQFLGELGYPGLLVFLGLLGSTALLAFRTSAQNHDPVRRAATVGFTALAIAGCIDIPMFFPSIAGLLWFVGGMAISQPPSTPSPKMRFAQRVLLLFSIVFILFGVQRFVTSYLTTQAERSGNQKNWLDAFATASIVRQLRPSYDDEVRLLLLMNFGKKVPTERDETRTLAERIVRQNPLQATAYLILGTMAQEDGKLDQAERYYRKGLTADPYFTSDLAVSLGKLLLVQQRIDEGLSFLQHALATMNLMGNVPATSTLHELSAIALLSRDQRDEARAQLEEAIRVNPDNVNARKILEKEFP